MNDIVLHSAQLPDNLPDLSKFALIGREKLNAVRAEIRAIEKVGLAQEVHQQKLQEAQEIAEAVLDAEVQIGKLTAEIPKASGERTDLKPIDSNVGRLQTKSQTLEEIGIHQKQAQRFETLAKYPEAVEKAKEEARQDGRIVTRQNALDEIHNQVCGKSRSPRQIHKDYIESVKQEREEFQEKKDAGVVSVRDVAKDRENAETIAHELWSRLIKVGKPISEIYMEMSEQEIDIREMAKILTNSEMESLKSRIRIWILRLNQILEVIEN